MENPTSSPMVVAAQSPGEAAAPVRSPESETPAVETEMLIEEISIDGMCGVY